MKTKILLNLKPFYVSVSQSVNHAIIYGMQKGRRNGNPLKNTLSLIHANAMAVSGGEKGG